MKYRVYFQQMHKGSARPSDDGLILEIAVDETQFALVPNVGDFVNIDNRSHGPDCANARGRVRSRLFSYMGEYCLVNIVVEETDDDWGKLIKE